MDSYNSKKPSIIDQTATVSTPSNPYIQMAEKWKLVETLRGGTPSMRRAGLIYLPKEPKETTEAWEFRLKRTFLFNLYWRTITSLVGMAFIKPVVVSNAPKGLEYLEFNFDGTGRNLTEIAHALCQDAVHYGFVHGIMDFPQVDTATMSYGQFKESGLRPYFTHVNPMNLIGWRNAEKPGIPMLQQIRVVETITAPSDVNEWADKDVTYVKVIRGEDVEVYKYDPEFPDQSYELVDIIENTLGYIPLVTAYANKTGFMTGEPSLYDLAQTNLRHWQSSSDQNNILHVARVPFLFAAGFEEGELAATEIGANRMIVTKSPDASISHVEHTGKAIGAGRQDLQDLEQQMATLGADMLISKGVGRMTATARKIDQSESLSTLQLALRSIEQMIEQAYIIAGNWIGIDASEVAVSIGDDLSIANEPNPTNALIALVASGLITDEQAIQEAKRQGILSSYFILSKDRPKADPDFGKEPTPVVVENVDEGGEDENTPEEDNSDNEED